MSGETVAVLGVGVTLMATILTFGFAFLGAHRATLAPLNDRMDQRMAGLEAALNDLRRHVTDIDRRLSFAPFRSQLIVGEPSKDRYVAASLGVRSGTR